MALSGDVVWEVRTTGDDNNGGGFNSSSSGTDYSQQNIAQLTVTDAATSGVGGTTLTSATGGFTADMVGNVCHLYDGTNLTEGWYEITGYTDSNTVTLDRAPDDGVGGVSGATCKVGGALASPGGLGAALVNAATNGQKAWIKSGTYTLTTSTPNTSGGPLHTDVANTSLWIEGYDSTRGDLGTKPVISAGTVTGVTILALRGQETYIQAARNLKIDGNSSAGTIGAGYVTTTYQQVWYIDCEIVNCGSCGVSGSGIHAVRCLAENCGNIGFNTYAQGVALFCEARNNAGDGFNVQYAVKCLARGNTGYGFAFGNHRYRAIGCVAYGNSSHGFGVGAYKNNTVIDCISVNNGGYGFWLINVYKGVMILNCSAYGNTSGNYNYPDYAWIEDWITITGDPFVDAANGDFRLNDTAGAGAVLRGAGLGVYGQTDNRDVGAVQHSDPSGGGGGGTSTARVIGA